MKGEGGGLWAAAAALGIAATIGISSTQTTRPSETATAQKTTQSSSYAITAATAPIDQGPCPDIEKLLQTFLLVDENDVVAPPSCFPNGQPPPRAQGMLLKEADKLRFVIATLPDPLHTHFPLVFDRATEAIQEAAQDDDNSYVYNSSWLPWKTQETSYVRIADQDKADQRKELKEDQPGILLFRGKLFEGNSPTHISDRHPFDSGLVVFIVGEEPTGGIHRRQFENAVKWITALQPKTDAHTLPVQILGPTFSGSIPSLINLLRETATSLSGRVAQHLRIFSGTVSSNAGVHWLNQATYHEDLALLNIEFRSFEHSGNLDIDRYCRYMIASGMDLAKLAIVSEDETAFGSEYKNGISGSSPCHPIDTPADAPKPGPVYLYYPRDISTLRAAYQSQSIFSHPPAQPSGEPSRHTLQSDLADPEGKDHDTITAYGGDQTALSQEAELQQIVSLLRAHSTQYLLVRSSNPLDQLFLSHFFRMTYPEGRIVLVGAELLFRRETGSSGLNGVMTLSTYPLLPWGQDWTRNLVKDNSNGPFHSHRVFTNDGVEGTYVAARFLLRQDPITPPGTEPSATASDVDDVANSFVPCNYVDPSNPAYLPDYAPPFWLNEAGRACRYPPTWLSVLGNGGFWPVAVMNYPTRVGNPRPPLIAELGEKENRFCRLRQSISSIGWSLGFLFGRKPSGGSIGSTQPWLPMPPSMQLLIFATLLWAIFHAICCSGASITVRPAHRAHFVRPNHCPSANACDANYLHRQQNTHRALIMFGSILVALLPITLAWGYGEMWPGGEPLPNPRLYRFLLSIIWFIAALAVCMNAWVEEYLFEQNDEAPARPACSDTRPRLRERITRRAQGCLVWICELEIPPACTWWTLVWFLVLTVFLYWCVDFSLDGALNDANRIPTYWRAINLTTGLSPLVPLVALIVGLYGWFWYSLQGLAFLGEDRPRLPMADSLIIPASGEGEIPKHDSQDLLRMLSREWAGDFLEEWCSPFATHAVVAAVVCFGVILVIGWLVFGFPSIRNLGSTDYSIAFSLWLVLCISILLANAWQLSRIWLRLRHLLQFLDKLPLRRTLPALDKFSWGSVWKMSDNVLDVRYKYIFRQLESLIQLQGSLQAWQGRRRAEDEKAPANEKTLVRPLIEAIGKTTEKRAAFAAWYSLHWDNWKARRMTHLKAVQDSIAETAAVMLTKLLVPAWRQGGQPLLLGPGSKAEQSGKAAEPGKDTDAIPPYILNAEKLVCLLYMAFIQNILGRLRSLVMGMICVFLGITVSVASYPFDPRPLLSGIVVILFAVLSVTIVVVYSQMHRDPTLSNLTGTTPGELGTDFWLKLAGFGAGPVLGLVASVFPEFTDFIFSWVQPGIASIK
jgi:hypothetical protein